MVVTKEGDQYLARAEGLSIFTEAKSLDELKRNIREAVALHLGNGGIIKDVAGHCEVAEDEVLAAIRRGRGRAPR